MARTHRSHPFRLLAGALALTGLVGLATACGNDDDEASVSETTAAAATETTAAAMTETTAAAMTETTAADASAAAAAPVSVKTRDEGKLTVCSDIPYAPFEFNDDSGDVVGVDADLIRGIAEGLGLEAEFVDTDFDGIFAALAAKRCDAISSSVSITEERKQQNDFTQGYFSIQQSLLVRKGEEATLNDLPALKGKTVAVQSGTTGADFAKANAEANGYTVKEFTGADDMFTALDAKQVDAALQDFPINAYRAQQSGTSVVSKKFEGQGEEYGFVVPKDNPELTAAMNAQLDAMRADGRYDAILKKYLGDLAAS